MMGLGLLLLSLVGGIIWWTRFHTPNEIELTLATGPVGNAFHSMGEGIADFVNKTDPNITIHLSPTA